MTILMWGIIAVVALIVLMLFVYYNKFVTLSHQVENSLSQIDVQLTKRGDLVPNLISTIKGYTSHEKRIITAVTDARKAMLSAKGIEKKMTAGNQLQTALKSIFAIAEAYPDLKANQNFLQLQEELSAIEDKIAYARQYYNDGIMSYNISVETLPGKFFANLYGFKNKEYIKLPEASRVVPKVSF